MATSPLLKGIPRSKRILDLTLTIIGGLVALPLMALIAILIRSFLGRPVVFRQRRPGYRGLPFTLYKFRTMKELHALDGTPHPDDLRLTPLGRFLRATSLDELPELYNVLRGDMSLVGPRPLLMQYLDRYTVQQARRMLSLPGMTGWAQINGRNNVTWEDKFSLDTWYVDHWSFWLDLKILLLTPLKVLRREGISQPGNATAIEFMGSQPTKGRRS
ncbi:MAG TPA: sugar transferase [Anaerolineales bacterium]|nr:sugar transferase [Anaerolineales bacterium]HLE72724.1 sugar transferase [Anaerolineales bacterium]